MSASDNYSLSLFTGKATSATAFKDKKPTNRLGLGQAKRHATIIRPKAVERGIIGRLIELREMPTGSSR